MSGREKLCARDRAVLLAADDLRRATESRKRAQKGQCVTTYLNALTYEEECQYSLFGACWRASEGGE